MSDDTDFEELEQIPWASLAAATPDPRTRYLSVAVAVVAVVAAIAWFTLRSGGAEAVPVPATTTTLAIELPPSTGATPVTTSTEPTVYSEADLMLIDVGDEERLAVMQAEWLARDYLTVDDDPQVAERIAALLPEVERGTKGAYVEWAEAFAVTTIEPGRYRVEVAYRLLSETDDGFVRQPPAALLVELSVDVDGTTHLVSAPTETPLPTMTPTES